MADNEATKQHLGTFRRPRGYDKWAPEKKRAFAKRVADVMRRRAGLPPTDAQGNAKRA